MRNTKRLKMTKVTKQTKMIKMIKTYQNDQKHQNGPKWSKSSKRTKTAKTAQYVDAINLFVVAVRRGVTCGGVPGWCPFAQATPSTKHVSPPEMRGAPFCTVCFKNGVIHSDGLPTHVRAQPRVIPNLGCPDPLHLSHLN